MNEGAVTILADGTILYSNRQFGQMTGAFPSGIVGRPFHDFVPVSDRLTLNGFIHQARFRPASRRRLGSATGRPPRSPCRFRPPDRPRRHEDPCPCRDGLSERKRHEEIVAAERLSRYILEQSLEGVAVCVNGRILFASRRLHRDLREKSPAAAFDSLFPLTMPGSEPFSVEIPQSGKVVQGAEVGYQNPTGRTIP